MSASRNSCRGLIVLADGAQAAFAAGAVAALARAGTRWGWGHGAGLGAQVAVLALLGEAEEIERRWRRQGELGCPLLRSAVAAAQERLAGVSGVAVTPDGWTLPGWLDDAALAEHLAPEMAALPERLRAAGARCTVAVQELASAASADVELSELDAVQAGATLLVAAAFPGGWGPRGEEGGPARWGGATAAMPDIVPGGPGSEACDLVCGFPVPPVARPAASGSLFELVQRRDELHAALAVQRWVEARPPEGVRLVAPRSDLYLRWTARDGADLGLEYPLPWEHNGELIRHALAFGAQSAAATL